MIDIFKAKWQIIVDAMFNHPIVFLLAILCILACVALAVLTLYMVGKFQVLQYPFLLFIGFLIANFYIEILLRIFKLFN
ncbi:hypothetical protein QR665_18240 [Acinetobacter gerneri]|uniref:hypothetical protein n=1 Tax=Acinetobacter gerneri TaxID=202952 RepID=UPI0029366BB9|nr:hypothetical protein [Acinetobacter gerneri]MDV2441383.1 hypothetical protein [Acinetobacter gerneri]